MSAFGDSEHIWPGLDQVSDRHMATCMQDLRISNWDPIVIFGCVAFKTLTHTVGCCIQTSINGQLFRVKTLQWFTATDGCF